MRVVFLIDSLGRGGAERSTALLVRSLPALEVEPIVVCLRHEADSDEPALRDAGLDVRVLGPQSRAGRILAVRKLLAAERPDVLHTALAESDLVGRLAAAGTPVRVVSSLVNTPYVEARLAGEGVTRWKLRAHQGIDAVTGLLLVDRFHAVTPGVASHAVWALRVPRARITVIPRGRDPEALGRRTPERRAAGRERLGIAPEAVMVLAVGRHEPQKQFDVLLRAAALLRDRVPGLVVWIAGREGSSSSMLRLLIDQLELAGVVRLLGHRDDVADLLAASDIFALTSRYEGAAGAAIEALALETPIVASRLEGLEGVLEEGRNATVVPSGDVGAVAGGIQRVLGDPGRAAALSARGRQDFETNYTLAAHAEAMAALYRNVAATRSRPTTGRPG